MVCREPQLSPGNNNTRALALKRKPDWEGSLNASGKRVSTSDGAQALGVGACGSREQDEGKPSGTS